ncbi:phosphatase [Paenibacillus sp. BIHB 4019]|uniref:Phosphatase n=1 Tax=Paenibacillus sp. BIHB 4019 TaxID=1870819 RepID=A0A1B2DND6_9BACL|nr:HAD family phosphatase [Paenibacillus sp. BIHB 4019]ANY69224.1 phosphatase [Paenibacillus sp. BIHB 4019]
MKAFIFDMDGVIIDSEPLHFDVDMETMEHLGFKVTQDDLEKYVGMTNPAMWRLIRVEYGMEQTVEEIISYQLRRKIEELRARDFAPIAGVLSLLAELKQRNLPIALASSSPRIFIEEVLSKFDITDYFASIVSGEEVPSGKPAPDVYLEAARQLGVLPADCVVLEDSRNGVIAAKEAGMRCIGYINIHSGDQDLSRADWIVKAIKDIPLSQL